MEFDDKTRLQNIASFNNKSVELLRAKFQPNTNLSKDTLRKFFQSPKKDRSKRYYNSSVDNLNASYESKEGEKKFASTTKVGKARFLSSTDHSPKDAKTHMRLQS